MGGSLKRFAKKRFAMKDAQSTVHSPGATKAMNKVDRRMKEIQVNPGIGRNKPKKRIYPQKINLLLPVGYSY